MRARVLLLPLMILVVLCVVQVSAPLTELNVPSLRKIVSSSDWVTTQVIPDPYLEGAPSFVTNGSSDEFSYSHSSEESSVNLTWAHNAGTPLDFKDPSSFDIEEDTDCNDFVYFTESFDWPLEILPADANVSFEYAVYIGGAFDSDVDAALWFRIQVFVVDSSGIWESVYCSSPPYVNTPMPFRADLNYFDLTEIWGGMIENEMGNQADPFDNAKVAFCLAPARTFETSGEGPYLHPWMNVTGSVSVIISTLKLDIVYDQPGGIDMLTVGLVLGGVAVAAIVLVAATKKIRRRKALPQGPF